MLRRVWFLLLLTVQLQAQEKPYQLKLSGFPEKHQSRLADAYADSLSTIKAVNTVVNQLQFKGYFNASVLKYYWDNKVLHVTLEAGKPYQMANLSNGNIQPQVLAEIKFREKFYQDELWDIGQINSVKDDILNWYENHGYPFAQVWLDSISIQKEKISAKLFSIPGTKITIDTLRLVGSAKINPKYLHAYLGFKEGDSYDETKVINIDKRLQDLSFAKQVKATEVVFSDEYAKINIFLDKENANQFDGVIGFLPNNTTGKLQLTGDFKLKLQNAFKRGELLNFNYRGLPAQSQELNLSFDYPYLLNTQIGIFSNISFFKRDSSFLNLNARLGFAYQYQLDKSVGFFVESFTGNQVANVLNQTTNTAGNIRTIYYGLETNIQSLNNNIIPTKGYKVYLNFGAGKRNLSSDTIPVNGRSQFKIQADLNYYIYLSKRSNIYLHNQSAFISGDNLFENELFRIGGIKTFRGFDEQSLLASTYSIQTIEYRFFLEQRSFLNLFYEQAYLQSNINANQLKDYPFSFGAGFTFQTKAGIVSLNYALGKQQNNLLNLQRGKIHFGIVSYF
ncbi:ShlB/FhaC/HecB family hemolysin secretion/activation protein [Pedobacter glucosidilyticus]|uniref:ShlB/FhaC/HecB family hemolysin secretion/activation protein n=1 Tax=Pedobacter glucosidilyticus TaxID=1122941 RepID=UPI0004049743|nr:ShlB/FhaC/HecB family hemolysin secretion/activation protein [Pedobacter glucosidilyticus]